MGRYLLRRILGIVPVLLVIFTLSFVLMRAAPGGPFDAEKPVPAEVKRNLERQYHLREPWCEARFLPALQQPALSADAERAIRAESAGASRLEQLCTGAFQYGWLLSNYVRGDFGPSYKYKDRSVNEFIASGLPITIRLGLVAVVFALLIGLGAGLISAMKQNLWQDHAAMGAALLGISIPNFVLGPVLIFVFSLTLFWLPPARWDGWQYMILPGFTLGSVYAAYIARLTRGGMLEVVRQDYIRTARAKGLSERLVILRHAVRGGLLPVVSYLGPAMAGLFTGSIVIERIFNIPGMGRYFVDAALNRDITLAMAVVVVDAVFLLVANLVVDVVLGLLDPRVRYE
ncbi:ABC transporter permease [Vulgatibacter incomptus]|uniref:Oligopeptide transport system permease protein OppB n=1 Tax=Vulgatibacter incomptus TaxID=1391653 RepID=A0A0K1PA75_9BACT|nr:ABC transporter permease subunit [Vulgatibacter incomptus]AKU90438.1 Oligopeptide transport system permease protein OppB [Vulgatibacter incomptus]